MDREKRGAIRSYSERYNALREAMEQRDKGKESERAGKGGSVQEAGDAAGQTVAAFGSEDANHTRVSNSSMREDLREGSGREEKFSVPQGLAEKSEIDSNGANASGEGGRFSVEAAAAGELLAVAAPGGVAVHDRGEKKMNMNPQFNFRHQQVVLNTACALRELMEPREGYVVVAPLSLVLSGAGSARIEPDIMVLPPDASFTETDVKATPELVVEVVTPESAHDDMGARRDLYQAAGVREYWLVHLTYDMVQRYSLGEGGGYRLEVFGCADAITPHFCQLGEVRVADLLRGDV